MDTIDYSYISIPNSENNDSTKLTSNTEGTPPHLCLPKIPNLDYTLCAKPANCIDSVCFTKVNNLDIARPCNNKIFCYYATLKLGAACKIAMSALKLDTPYCKNMCSYEAGAYSRCLSENESQELSLTACMGKKYIPDLLHDQFPCYLQKRCADPSTPYCLENCNSMQAANFLTSPFLCNY